MLNKAAADVMNPPIATSYDALHLLSRAAGESEKADRQCNHLGSPSATFASPGSTNHSHHRTISNNMTPNNVIDPAMMLDDAQETQLIDTAGTMNALRAWSRMRFVRAGWFTAREAMDYIE